MQQRTIFSLFTPLTAEDSLPHHFNMQRAHGFSPTLAVLVLESCECVRLVLVALHMQVCRFEKLDTLEFGADASIRRRQNVSLVPLQRRCEIVGEHFDNALAIFSLCDDSDKDNWIQMFAIYIVRDGRLVAACKPRILDHIMWEPASIDEGRTLLGTAYNIAARYDILIDTRTGVQRAHKLDIDGQLVISDHKWRSNVSSARVQNLKNIF